MFLGKHVATGSVEAMSQVIKGLDKQEQLVNTPVKVNDFIIPSNNDTVIGFDAGKLPMGDNKEVVAAINNLAAALSNQEVKLEIDGKQVASTLYNQSMNVG